MSPKKENSEASSRLAAPQKRSLFERQKAEAEAKRLREQEETAAVYEDFVKSFDNEEEDDTFGSSAPSTGVFSRRHFSAQTGPAGRGSFSKGRGISGPGSLGPPPAPFTKKRAFDGGPPNRDYRPGMFAYDEPEYKDSKPAFEASDDEEDDSSKSRALERAAPKPTLHLSSLPPGTSTSVVKAIIPSNLNIDAVRFISPSGPSARRSVSAIVTVAKDTPAGDLDTAVSALQNRYLGWGFYLSISRHLSSAVVSSALPSGPGASNANLPFGAKPLGPGPAFGLSRAPPPGPHRGGFAPPASYGPAGAMNRGMPPVQVNVKPPTDLKQLKLIHKIVECLLTNGPEFEALLMSRPEIQRDERWAWLWDPRSEGGVYYRWRLWDILTNAQKRIKFGTGRNDNATQTLFETSPVWAAPEGILPFEYTTNIEEFISDSDYDSSEDEDSGDEGRKRLQYLQAGAPIPESGAPGEADLPTYLNPLHKAKLVHLLSRLPTSIGRLRRGDVARITAFAISHAGSGADEVVSLLTANIHRPFNNLLNTSNGRDPDDMEEDELGQDKDKEKEKEDPTPSKLIALYVISDILSSSSTSGVRHAWRYRSLFEASLRVHNTFAHLGRLEKDLAWGKLRAEKWRRSIMTLLGLWEGWCVFPAKAQEEFVEMFNNPPLTVAEQEAAEREERERAEREKGKSRWKAVGAGQESADTNDATAEVDATGDDVDGEPMSDVDGEPMDSDLDGEPIDLDGEPMVEDEDGETMVDETTEADVQPQEQNLPPGSAAVESRRRRPRAEDMFADSDGE